LRMADRVLIIILCYNGADYLRDCLSSLSKLNYSKDSFEILVIDNASTDNSVATINSLQSTINNLILIQNKTNLGFATGNNIGLQYAINHNFDYVYLLNQDTVVEPDFLEKAVEIGESDIQIGAVQSKLLLFQDKTKINSIGNEIHYLGFGFAGGYQLPDQELEVREITYSSGAASLYRILALKQVGLFNPDFFMYHEDTDLGWRLWLFGFKIILAPKSVVYHKYEFSRSIQKYYFMERNRYLVLLQNYKWQTLLLIGPACALMDVVMFFYSFFAGWWRENLKVCWYFCHLKNWQKIIKTRRRVQSKRKITDREMVERFVGKIEFQDLDNPLLTNLVNPVFNLYWQIVKRLIFW